MNVDIPLSCLVYCDLSLTPLVSLLSCTLASLERSKTIFPNQLIHIFQSRVLNKSSDLVDISIYPSIIISKRYLDDSSKRIRICWRCGDAWLINKSIIDSSIQKLPCLNDNYCQRYHIHLLIEQIQVRNIIKEGCCQIHHTHMFIEGQATVKHTNRLFLILH